MNMIHRNRYASKNQINLKPIQNQGAKSELRGKSAPPYLQNNISIGKRQKFHVEKMIAGGGFGQIYRGFHNESGQEVAVKVEKATGNDSQRMILESKVLEELLGVEHFPRIFYIGSINRFNFIVMEMLGMNLGEIRKSMPHRKLSIHSSIRIGIQVIDGLESLHQKGWLHRDLKPTNCCVGREENRRNIYLVDFGMARRYRNEDGSYREARHYCGFRGTTRYCSYRMHDRREQGPLDDLWCLYYTLAELIEGYLPWRDMESVDEMAQVKKTMKHETIFPSMPKQFASFDRNLRRLRQNSTPDYRKFQDILMSCVKFVDTNAEFEWDVLET